MLVVSTKTRSTCRFSRVATDANTSAAISCNASSRKSIARYAASSLNVGRCSMNTRSVTHFVAASLLPGSRALAPSQVAAWAGHSVAVLLRVYAHAIDGQEDIAHAASPTPSVQLRHV